MKNLFNKIIATGILARNLVLSRNAYSQKVEKTKNGFKQYNKAGWLIREVDGEKTSDYEYNDKGQITKETKLYNKNADGKIDKIKTWSYEYNDKGQKIKETKLYDKNADGEIDEIGK